MAFWYVLNKHNLSKMLVNKLCMKKAFNSIWCHQNLFVKKDNTINWCFLHSLYFLELITLWWGCVSPPHFCEFPLKNQEAKREDNEFKGWWTRVNVQLNVSISIKIALPISPYKIFFNYSNGHGCYF